MKKTVSRIFFIALTVYSSFAAGQQDLIPSQHFLQDSSYSSLLRVSGNYFFASNAITSELAREFYIKGFITEEMKNNSSQHLKSENRFGGELNASIDFIFRPDSNDRNIQAYLSLRQKNFVASSFSRDLFEIYFRGNKNYADKTAELSPFSFLNIDYKQFTIGLGKRIPSIPPENLEVPKDDSTDTELKLQRNEHPYLYIGVDLSVNAGKSFLTIGSNSASLYTHPDGRYLDAALDATIQTDDSSGIHPSYIDGYGTSFDFYIQYVSDNNILSLSGENIGLIKWNKWSTEVTMDTLFHFDGVDVSDLLDLNDTVAGDISIDSTFYYNLIKSRNETRVSTALPFKTSLSYSHYFMSKRLLATVGSDLLGIKILKKTNAYLRFYGILNYKLRPTDEISLYLSYGGFTTFHSGLSYARRFPYKLKLEVGSSYLYPLINYKKGTSQGVWFAISKGF